IELIDVLRELSKEELITVILDLAEKDEVLESNLVYKYSKHDYEDEIKLCKKAIKEVVRAHKGRQGFIPYRDVFDYVRDMEAILEKASKTSDHNVAVAIPLLVLEEAIKAFQYADDSSGSIGFLVRGAIKELSEIAMYAEDYELEQRAEIFDAILRQCDSPIFNGWEEFSIELLSVCLEFADVPTLRAKLQDKVNTLLRAYTDNRYRKEELLHIQFDLVNEYGSSEEVEAFLKENLQYSSFREKYIQQQLSEGNYQKALELAVEGESQDEKLRGLVLQWKAYRYKAYKGLGYKEDQVKLAKELLFAGKFDYYAELKEICAKDDPNVYEDLKQEMKKNISNGHVESTYLQVIEAEKDLEAMLDYVMEKPYNIERYKDNLIEEYRVEVIEIYTKFVQGLASSATNRKEYKLVCKKLKEYLYIAGKEKQEALKEEFKTLYNRKPAFIDELGKI